MTRSFSSPHETGDGDRLNALLGLAASARLSECRVALQHSLGAGSSVESVRGPIVAFATAARQEGLPPERVLVLFKAMVVNVSALKHQDVEERTEVIRALVAMSIKAYYDQTES